MPHPIPINMNTPRKRSHAEVIEEELTGHFAPKMPPERLRKRHSPSRTTTSECSHVSEWIDNLPESFPSGDIPQHRLATKQSDSFIDAASVISSDQKPRDGKSVSYTHNGYQMLLWTMGVLLDSELAISEESDIFCQSLLVG
jgi:hypothetical protein